jgi:hypothetical protein
MKRWKFDRWFVPLRKLAQKKVEETNLQVEVMEHGKKPLTAVLVKEPCQKRERDAR